jgi:hypothetical protein
MYTPLSFVSMLRDWFVAALLMVTLAAETAAPDTSTTEPSTRPVVYWAFNIAAPRIAASISFPDLCMMMGYSEGIAAG